MDIFFFFSRESQFLFYSDMNLFFFSFYSDIKYSHDFKVRGATYLTDKKKVRIVDILFLMLMPCESPFDEENRIS